MCSCSKKHVGLPEGKRNKAEREDARRESSGNEHLEDLGAKTSERKQAGFHADNAGNGVEEGKCSTASASDASRESSADRARVLPAVLNMFFCARAQDGKRTVQSGLNTLTYLF